MPIHCESHITEVTVYARGALVRRRLVVPAELPDGEVELRVSGVTPLCEPGSLRARLQGGGRGVVSVRSALRVPEPGPLVGPSVQEVRDLTSRIERLGAEEGRLRARRKRLLEQALDPTLKPQSLLERLEVRVGDSIACLQGLDAICAELDERLLALGEVRRAVEEQRDAAAVRDAQAQTAARRGAGHPRREFTVRLGARAGAAAAVEALEVSYVVREARFWPVYTLRLSEGGRRAELLLEALVAQLSGEDWTGARLSLSTADLLFDARLPELPSLRFGRAQAPPRRAYRPPPDGLDRMFEGHDRVFAGSPPPAGGAPADDAFEAEWTSVRARPAPEAPGAVPEALEGGMDGGATGRHALDDGDRLKDAREEAAVDELEEAPTQVRLSNAPLAKKRGGAPSLGRGAPRPQGLPPPAPMASYAMPVAASPARSRGLVGGFLGAVSEVADSFGGGGAPGGSGYGGAPEPEPDKDEPEALEPGGAWLDFDALQLGGPAATGSSAGRGRLRPAPGAGSQARAQGQAAARLEAITTPIAQVRDPQSSRGRFDHRYDAQGRCDVPSDGLCHRVSLAAAQAAATLRFRTVPREAAEVYREVELQNPLAAPLLGGPVDVYVEGSLLLQTSIDPIDRGGTFTVGMGVEERLRLARNARSEEESAGLMGGSTVVTHTVSIEITSSLGREVQVEVLDRIPVTDDKSVEIKRVYARPEGEAYKQQGRGQPVRGGWLWRLTVPPAVPPAAPAAGQPQKRSVIEFQYRVILPAKSEIVGGNRRE